MRSCRAGVDVIAHTTPRSGPWDEATVAAMKERRVALTAALTLGTYFMRHDRISVQEEAVNTAIGPLRSWVASGGTVLLGADIGVVDYDPSTDYALMARAGLSFQQILASLTVAPAERFGGLEHPGRIAAGLEADLVVLKDDHSGSI